MCREIDKSSAGYRLHPLVEPRAQTACADRQMFFSALASPVWGEQPGVMNYSWFLCTTVLRAEGGMEDAVDGRMNR